jgi:hypothetical protein
MYHKLSISTLLRSQHLSPNHRRNYSVLSSSGIQRRQSRCFARIDFLLSRPMSNSATLLSGATVVLDPGLSAVSATSTLPEISTFGYTFVSDPRLSAVSSTLPDGGRQTITSFQVVGAAPSVLTTLFTPPSDCLGRTWTSNTSAYGALVCTRAYTSSCFPSGFAKEQNVIYSPGVCPQGYNPGAMFSTPTSPMVTSCVCCPT